MNRRKDNGPGPIPNRWLHCPMKSEVFIANKFVAFKTPLSKKFDDQVEEHSFYPEMIFDVIKTYYKVSSSMLSTFHEILRIS